MIDENNKLKELEDRIKNLEDRETHIIALFKEVDKTFGHILRRLEEIENRIT